jgi:hypothetical protein
MFYSCEQRAKRKFLHFYLTTAARVKNPAACCAASLMPRQLAAGSLILAPNIFVLKYFDYQSIYHIVLLCQDKIEKYSNLFLQRR